MSLLTNQTLSRQLIRQSSDSREQTTHVRRVLRMLLAQDGSTTRLCEAVACGPVSLHVLEQRTVDAVPAEVSNTLPGARFMERITCLAANGEVMMDNLVYIALEGLSEDLRTDLESATVSIGHLLTRLWVRRSSVDTAPMLYERLWGAVGLPDIEASRAYCIATPDGPRMLIAETYRRGMLMEHNGFSVC